jgi:4-amino-4-deoxy-L-arabinose transferase-like glycosyltransferase
LARQERGEWREGALLALVVLGAALLRLVALGRFPGGLYHDEAYNGLDALGVLQGNTPLFFTANQGREPLFIYLAAASVAVWGRTPGALRLVAALVGTGTVAATYFLGRELLGRRVGMLAAILAATTVWTINLSRVALRAGTLPLLLAVAMALLWRALQRRSWPTMLAAGACYGLTFYTYLAARLTPLLLLLFILYAWRWQRSLLWGRGWLLFALAAALVAAPLGGYLATHAALLGRADQISILNPALNQGDLGGTLLKQAARAAGMFFYRGDFIPRHNVPWRPVFDPLLGAAFALGVGVALWRARREAAGVLALLWVGVMLLPTVFAEGAPHLLRAVGVLPAALLFPALGLETCWRALAWRGWRVGGAVLVGATLILSAALGLEAYGRHLRSAPVYYQFESGAVELAATINRYLGQGWRGEGLGVPAPEAHPGRRVILDERLWNNWASVRYLCPTTPGLIVIPPNEGVPISSVMPETLIALWPYDQARPALVLLPRECMIVAEEGAREQGDLETESRLLYVTWRSADPTAAPRNSGARWAEGVTLRGYRRARLANGDEEVMLYWQAAQPLAAHYTVFVHALCGEALVAQHDGPPAQGYYDTTLWRAGDVIADRHLLTAPAACAVGGTRLRVGLYRGETMAHLAVLDAAGNPTAQTSVILP